MGYDTTGWGVDVPSRPKQRQRGNRYRPRMPSARGGGPIVVCLDTSWSMTGGGNVGKSGCGVVCDDGERGGEGLYRRGFFVGKECDVKWGVEWSGGCVAGGTVVGFFEFGLW